MNQSKHCNFANILQDSRTSRKDSTRRNLNTGIISLKENMMPYYFSEDKLPKPVVFFFFLINTIPTQRTLEKMTVKISKYSEDNDH